VGFNDWINITPASMASDARMVEVDKAAKNELAEQIQTKVRNQINPGIDIRSAKKVHSVRASEEGGRIVITDKPGPMDAPKDSGPGGIEDLFSMGSGIPQVRQGKMEFRTIQDDQLWTRQSQDEQDQSVRQTVTDTVRMGIVDAHTKAVKDVENRYPQEKNK